MTILCSIVAGVIGYCINEIRWRRKITDVTTVIDKLTAKLREIAENAQGQEDQK